MHLRATSHQHKPLCVMTALMLALWSLALCACSTVTIYEEEPETPVGQIIPSKVAIVHTAGMAGSFDSSETSLGIAAITQLSHDLEDDGYDVVLLDSGNTLASPGGLDLSDAEVPVAYLNAAGLDATLASAGELSLGQSLLDKRLSQADFSLLSANLVDGTTGETTLMATKTVKLRDNRQVGIFALTAPEDLGHVGPYEARGLKADADALVPVAQKCVDELRGQGCLLVVCLSDLGRSTAEGSLGPQELAQGVSGIDFVLDVSGSQWTQTQATDAAGEETLVVETPEGLASASVVTWERGTSAAKSVDAGSYDGLDEQVAALVTQTDIETDAQLKAALATSGFDIPSQASDTGESAFGDLVADAVLWTAQSGSDGSAAAAIVDTGSLASGLAKGNVTRADALGCCPHASTRLYTVTASGKDLQDALSAELAGSQVSPVQIAGMSIELRAGKDDEGPAEARIKAIGGKDLSPTKTYTVAITSKALFGETALAKLAADDLSNVACLDTSAGTALCDYLSHKCQPTVPTSYQKPEGRIAARKGKENAG